MTKPALLKWYGGKTALSNWIVPLLPRHEVYVEAFGGSMGVLLAKRPSRVEVYNDLDKEVVNFWRVVRDPFAMKALQLRLELTPYARAERAWAKMAYAETDDSVERAARWWTWVSQTFSANPYGAGGWSFSRGAGSGAASKYLSRIDRLAEVHARIMGVQIECDPWQVILDRYDAPGTCFYLDPPYIHDTRTRADHGYAHEMTDTDHAALVERLLGLTGQVVLSGYEHPIYMPLKDAGWEMFRRNVTASASGRTRHEGKIQEATARTEVLWVSARRGTLPMFNVPSEYETACIANDNVR